MRGRGGVIASRSRVKSGNLTIKIKRGGVGRMSGSGPSGRKATPRALLACTLAQRAGVSAVVTKRQAEALTRRASPPAVIWGKPIYQCFEFPDRGVSRIIGPEGFEPIEIVNPHEAIIRCHALNRATWGT